MAEERTLPGWPKKKLVKEVRWFLNNMGIRPTQCKIWYATWEWVEKIASSYYFKRYPNPSEIAAQYVFLLLVDLKRDNRLKLPYRSAQHVPESVRAMLMPVGLPGPTLVGLPAPVIPQDGENMTPAGIFEENAGDGKKRRMRKQNDGKIPDPV